MSFLRFVHLTSGLSLAAVALLMMRRRQRDGYAEPLLWFILVNLCGLAAVTLETMPQPGLWSAGYPLLFAYVTLLPSAWYFLGSRWGLHPDERTTRRRVVEGVVLLASVFFFLLALLRRTIDLTLVDGRWYVDLRGWSVAISAFWVVGATAAMYSVESSYRSSLGLTRQKLKRSFFPLLACGIGFLAVATVAMLYRQLSDLMLTINFALVALVAVMVSRHYLRFDAAGEGVILTGKGIHSSIVVVLVGVYFLVIGLVGKILIRYDLDEGLFYSIVLLVLLAVTFLLLIGSRAARYRPRIVPGPGGVGAGPLRTSPAQGVLAEEWREFAEEMSVLLSLDMIYDRTRRLLQRLLHIDHSVLVIKEPAPSVNFTLYAGDGVDRGLPGDRLERLAQWLYRHGHPVEATTLAEKAPQEAAELEAIRTKIPQDLFLLVPLVARQQFLGFWGVGRHQSGRDLSSDEIGFIEAAANPVSLTILGARITEELVISKEMESFHRIASFVLHDLKNSVAMLSMLLQNAERNMDNPEFQREALATIAQAVERQKKIISRLTGQEGKDRLSLEKADLAELVRKTLERVKIETLPSISLRFEVASGTEVIVDKEKVGSVFDNLVLNAIEAMPKGGTLDIKLADHQPAGMVGVSFRDSGMGMDEEFISTRLFKPFISTKPHGLGIGMYQSLEIIKAHKGRIEVRSRPNEGTEFLVYLPRVG